jgi:hypothetical protein
MHLKKHNQRSVHRAKHNISIYPQLRLDQSNKARTRVFPQPKSQTPGLTDVSKIAFGETEAPRAKRELEKLNEEE